MSETIGLAGALLALSTRVLDVVPAGSNGLSESGFRALDHLNKVGTATVHDTQKRIAVLPTQMSRLVRRLEAAGLVLSNINRGDRRKVDITITAAGRALYGRYREAKLGLIVNAVERLSDQEKAQLMNLIRRLSGE